MPKLLLVEDNDNNRDLLFRRLTRKGYDVIIAADGAEGLAMANAHNPDLILMDMTLPVMDGWEATRTLKASDLTRNIPVIALTALALAGDREQALAAGCDDYEPKPVNLSRLMEKIELLVKRNSP